MRLSTPSPDGVPCGRKLRPDPGRLQSCARGTALDEGLYERLRAFESQPSVRNAPARVVCPPLDEKGYYEFRAT